MCSGSGWLSHGIPESWLPLWVEPGAEVFLLLIPICGAFFWGSDCGSWAQKGACSQCLGIIPGTDLGSDDPSSRCLHPVFWDGTCALASSGLPSKILLLLDRSACSSLPSFMESRQHPELDHPSSAPAWHGFGMQQLSARQGQNFGMIQVLRLLQPFPASVPLLPPSHSPSSAGDMLPEAIPSCRRNVASPECVPPLCDSVASGFLPPGTGTYGGTSLFPLFSCQGLIPPSVPDQEKFPGAAPMPYAQDLAL